MVDNPDRWALSRNLMPTSSTGTESHIALEDLILQSTSDLCSVIAIGRTVESIGAGKVIASDDEWTTYFEPLSRKASCIISVPSNHESTAWELDWLAQQKLFTRIVMMFTNLHFSSTDALYFDVRFVRSHLFSKGWSLPTELAKGSLTTFDTTGKSRSSVDNPKYKKRVIRSVIQSILAENTSNR